MVHVYSSLPLLKTPQPKVKDKPISPKMKKSDPIKQVTPTKAVKPEFKAETKDFYMVELDPNDWVIRQCTAVCGIELNGHEIPKEMIPYINDNGNSWWNDHIKKYYQTFIGGHNFFEHNQTVSDSYGFLADATLRKIEVSNGKHVLYVDVIVCTNIPKSPNQSNVKEIIENKINTLSMGCVSDSLMCSKCGNISSDDDNDCDHIQRQLGRQYLGRNGISKVSAIIWDVNEQGKTEIGVNFFELSWVRVPAYVGATAAHDLKFDAGDKVYFKMPKSAIDRTDGWDAVNYWAKKGQLKIIK